MLSDQDYKNCNDSQASFEVSVRLGTLNIRILEGFQALLEDVVKDAEHLDFAGRPAC